MVTNAGLLIQKHRHVNLMEGAIGQNACLHMKPRNLTEVLLIRTIFYDRAPLFIRPPG